MGREWDICSGRNRTERGGLCGRRDTSRIGMGSSMCCSSRRLGGGSLE